MNRVEARDYWSARQLAAIRSLAFFLEPSSDRREQHLFDSLERMLRQVVHPINVALHRTNEADPATVGMARGERYAYVWDDLVAARSAARAALRDFDGDTSGLWGALEGIAKIDLPRPYYLLGTAGQPITLDGDVVRFLTVDDAHAYVVENHGPGAWNATAILASDFADLDDGGAA